MGLGQEFRVRRQERGLTLSFIADELKISERHLVAIEDEDYAQIGGSAYVTGFMRSYARYIGLEADSLIERYRAETQEVVADLEFDLPEEYNLSTQVKFGIAVASVVVVILTWVFIGSSGPREQIIADLETMALETESVTEPKETKAETPNQNNGVSPDDRAAEQIDSSVYENPVDVIEPADVSAMQRDDVVILELGPDVFTDSALGNGEVMNSPGDLSVEPSAQSVDLTTVVAPPVIDPKPASKPVDVFIQAKRMTWLRLSDEDGRILLSSVVDEGARYKLNDDVIYFVASRDAGALEILRGDVVVDKIGNDNEIVARRRITRSLYLNRP